jgi:hypothetical protein
MFTRDVRLADVTAMKLIAPLAVLIALLIAVPGQAADGPHGCAATAVTSGVMASSATSCAFARRIAVVAAGRPEVRSTQSFTVRVLSPITGRRYVLTCGRTAQTDEVMCENKARRIWAWFDVQR